MHTYKTVLTANDPVAIKPDKITVPMKPHQLAALQKALYMERGDGIHYHIDAETSLHERGRTSYAYRGSLKISTNVGVIGDLVGYGKTLIALAIVAANPVADIATQQEHTYSFHGRHIGRLSVTCPTPITTLPDHFIRSTLVVVPRGPVYVQWHNAITTQTTLKVLALDNLVEIRKVCPPIGASLGELKAFFEQYDIILIKNTTVKVLLNYYNILAYGITIAWDRIIVDEAHDIIQSIPMFDYKFLWLISATYYYLPQCMYGNRTCIVSTVKDIVTEDNMPLLLVKGDAAFVRESFQVPDYIEHEHVCLVPRTLNMVRPFLNSAVLERMNANDIAGAIREMGGTNETEHNLVELVTKDIQKDIRNKELEEAYVQNLDIPIDTKQHRLKGISEELTRLRDKLQSLVDRVTRLSSKTCSICYDTYESPIMLPCTHVFCGGCFMRWVSNNRTCPECRTRVENKDIIAIVDEGNAPVATSTSSESPSPMNKIDMLLNIIGQKPHGKFLVFSEYDSTFTEITSCFDRSRIAYGEMKGTTPMMVKTLERFNNGELRVILLNTQHAGSGINISSATDVILFHKMPANKTQAVGRAQRVGRQTPLIVHNLVYPHEIDLHE